MLNKCVQAKLDRSDLKPSVISASNDFSCSIIALRLFYIYSNECIIYNNIFCNMNNDSIINSVFSVLFIFSLFCFKMQLFLSLQPLFTYVADDGT